MAYRREQLVDYLHKEIVFYGEDAVVLCDGKCEKAWGINTRSRVVITEGDDDDYYFLPDGELGIAPDDPGTYEGGHAKPVKSDGPDRMNKWCIGECERALILEPLHDPFKRPPNFERRVFNLTDRQLAADSEAND